MFRGMDYVYAVWQEKSFSEAAKKLYVSQPALSNSIKRVEDKLGMPIFDRSTTPITLTEVGKEYIHTAEQIKALQENFSNYMDDLHELQTGHINIGSGTMLSSYLLPSLIAGFKERYPYVTVQITEGDNRSLQEWLTEGLIDLAITNYPMPESIFECHYLQSEHIVLAVPREWEVNKELLAWQQSIENIISGKYLEPRYPVVPLEKFSDYPFILLTPEEPTHERVLKLCAEHDFTPKCILTLSQQLTSYNMACQGMGGTFVSDTLVKSTLPNPKVIYYKLEEPYAKRNISFYRRKNRYMSTCVRAFLKCAGECLENPDRE